MDTPRSSTGAPIGSFPFLPRSTRAVPLILNYIVAYQAMQRKALVKAGDTVLIIGTGGGIGTAFLQLERLAGLNMYAVASTGRHAVPTDYGATPIDYRSQDFGDVIRDAEPNGLDAVLDGMMRLETLRTSLAGERKSLSLYGTSSYFLFNRKPYLEDWATLFHLLVEDKINSVITARFPILHACEANALLESGGVTGNVVLVSPDYESARESLAEYIARRPISPNIVRPSDCSRFAAMDCTHPVRRGARHRCPGLQIGHRRGGKPPTNATPSQMTVDLSHCRMAIRRSTSMRANAPGLESWRKYMKSIPIGSTDKLLRFTCRQTCVLSS